MAGWHTHQGKAIALPIAHIDTDQLIPARFMSTPRAQGYGRYLLHDIRRHENGSLDPSFPLNTTTQASVLIAGPNFGCGSSREAAVYALVDAGFHAVFAPSFGDIFASNAVNNALLPARLDADTYEALIGHVADRDCSVLIDLAERRATFGDIEVRFDLTQAWQTKLMNGWDDIDLTRQHAQVIRAFKQEYAQRAPWTRPTVAD